MNSTDYSTHEKIVFELLIGFECKVILDWEWKWELNWLMDKVTNVDNLLMNLNENKHEIESVWYVNNNVKSEISCYPRWTWRFRLNLRRRKRKDEKRCSHAFGIKLSKLYLWMFMKRMKRMMGWTMQFWSFILIFICALFNTENVSSFQSLFTVILFCCLKRFVVVALWLSIFISLSSFRVFCG